MADPALIWPDRTIFRSQNETRWREQQAHRREVWRRRKEMIAALEAVVATPEKKP